MIHHGSPIHRPLTWDRSCLGEGSRGAGGTCPDGDVRARLGREWSLALDLRMDPRLQDAHDGLKMGHDVSGHVYHCKMKAKRHMYIEKCIYRNYLWYVNRR